ncbi:MAG: hypothetical protein JWO82_3737, partial [Akkermansiaceae bacterium]|nr:hypothetical protein [Akkermansiaceae bacterium]
GTANGDTLFWETAGTPETWTVSLLAAREPGKVDLPLNFAAALAALLERNAATGDFFPDDFPSAQPSFVARAFADFSEQLRTGLFIAGSLPFSRQLEQHLRALPWPWLSWYWMPPHPE